jgi:CorA-like Mg2+ transporter protein
MRPGAQQHFDRHRHRHRIGRIRENTEDIREEAKDALSHYSELVAGRQGRVLSSRTIVATVFLPLSFLTGYFGMNFRILTSDVQTTLWQFILLGLLLPIASAALPCCSSTGWSGASGCAGSSRREGRGRVRRLVPGVWGAASVLGAKGDCLARYDGAAERLHPGDKVEGGASELCDPVAVVDPGSLAA